MAKIMTKEFALYAFTHIFRFNGSVKDYGSKNYQTTLIESIPNISKTFLREDEKGNANSAITTDMGVWDPDNGSFTPSWYLLIKDGNGVGLIGEDLGWTKFLGSWCFIFKYKRLHNTPNGDDSIVLRNAENHNTYMKFNISSGGQEFWLDFGGDTWMRNQAIQLGIDVGQSVMITMTYSTYGGFKIYLDNTLKYTMNGNDFKSRWTLYDFNTIRMELVGVNNQLYDEIKISEKAWNKTEVSNIVDYGVDYEFEPLMINPFHSNQGITLDQSILTYKSGKDYTLQLYSNYNSRFEVNVKDKDGTILKSYDKTVQYSMYESDYEENNLFINSSVDAPLCESELYFDIKCTNLENEGYVTHSMVIDYDPIRDYQKFKVYKKEANTENVDISVYDETKWRRVKLTQEMYDKYLYGNAFYDFQTFNNNEVPIYIQPSYSSSTYDDVTESNTYFDDSGFNMYEYPTFYCPYRFTVKAISKRFRIIGHINTLD